MKHFVRRMQALAASLVVVAAGLQAQKAPRDMDRFIDQLMKKMTLEEKIGQLNLPVTGEITTGQAKSSDVAKRIRNGEVGGLFNLKGVERIREVQRQAVEESRLGIPLYLGYESHRRVRPYSCRRSQCRRYLVDIQPDGGRQP